MASTKNYLKRNLSKVREDDKISAERRSAVMSKIHSSGTKLELSVKERLQLSQTPPFLCNEKTIRGKPDFVFMDTRVCIFIDSDFWHGWQYPRWKGLLKNQFWKDKIENNRKRDRRITCYLKRHGWVVVRIWEHQLNADFERQIKKILDTLDKANSKNIDSSSHKQEIITQST